MPLPEITLKYPESNISSENTNLQKHHRTELYKKIHVQETIYLALGLTLFSDRGHQVPPSALCRHDPRSKPQQLRDFDQITTDQNGLKSAKKIGLIYLLIYNIW